MQYYRRTPESEAFRNAFYYALPPVIPSLAWQIEMQQRQTDRSRFPDTGLLWGEHSKHTTSWRQSALHFPIEPISQGSPFQIPYQGPKNISAPSATPMRVGIDTVAIDTSQHPNLFAVSTTPMPGNRK